MASTEPVISKMDVRVLRFTMGPFKRHALLSNDWPSMSTAGGPKKCLIVGAGRGRQIGGRANQISANEKQWLPDAVQALG